MRRTVSEQITIPAAIATQMLDHGRATLPSEACGLLAGEGALRRVTAFHPARNELASPLRYSIHPEDLVRIVLGIERSGDELVGIFHTHVGSPAVPSAADRREARYPAAVHVLASLAEPDASAESALRAWRIGDDTVREVAVVIG